MNKAVFLDRDGTMIHDPGYLDDLQKVRLYDNAVSGLKLLKKNGFKLIVITNQSGVARGYYNEAFVKKTHAYIDSLLAKHNVAIDAYYYCPHHKDAKLEKYRLECDCRKPKIGMINAAVKKFKIDLKQSWSIGDKLSDVKMGINAGTRTVLVLSGNGRKEQKKITPDTRPDIVAATLFSAARRIAGYL
jgi:D-glycero-D-manno-heptose 1,7-bisphosphate phosphatase